MRLRFRRKILYNFILVILSVILFIIILELALRLGSVFYAEDRVNQEKAEGDLIILTVGDSHTYGLGVGKDETYPFLVENLLNKFSDEEHKIINLAQAGINSAKIKESMQRYVDLYNPDIILLMIGVNNAWNKDGIKFDSMQAHKLSSSIKNFFYNFRTYRLYRLAVHNFIKAKELKTKEQPNLLGNTGYTMIEASDGTLVDYSTPKDSPIDYKDSKLVLEQDLIEINNILKQNNVKLILMTYPIIFEPTSKIIRKVSEEHHIYLIDNEEYFRILTKSNNENYYIDSSRHLNQKGYQLMSRLVYSKLIEKGLV